MKKNTKNKIIKSATELFSKHPFDEVSILQVCNNASVSNGAIYNFYKNKEELFIFLLDELIRRLEIQFKKIEGTTIENRLISFISLNIEITNKEFSLIKIYREGQYKFTNYEQKLRCVYLSALKKIYGRRLNELEYIYTISGIRFINVNYIKRGINPDIHFLAKIILNGFFEATNININTFDETDFYIRKLFCTENTRYRLLKTGEKLFGEKGYYNVKIKDITSAANVKVGSFYYYFENKEKFLRIIINNIKKEIISFLKDNQDPAFNNNETHVLFLYLLLEYFRKAPYKYELIRESEFFAEDLSAEYNKVLETLYLYGLKKLQYTKEQKQIIASVLIGMAHYMGIEFFFTRNIKSKKEFLNQIKLFLANGLPA